MLRSEVLVSPAQLSSELKHLSITPQVTNSDVIIDNASTLSSNDRVVRHAMFFIEPLFIKVQNTLFQIPRMAFEGREGSPFTDAASIQDHAIDSDAIAEGTSAQKPVVLHHVQVNDFENLLYVMAGASAFMFPKCPSTISNDKWESALQLSNMWNFTDIRAASIKALNLSYPCPINRISAARKFRVRLWFLSGIEELIKSDGTILDQPTCADTLGWETIARIYRARNEHGTYNKSLLVRNLLDGRSGLMYKCPFTNCVARDVWHDFGFVCPVATHVMQIKVDGVESSGYDMVAALELGVVDEFVREIVERVFADELKELQD